MEPPAGVTQLLLQWSQGDEAALKQLMPLVYDELRHMARSYLRHKPHQQTLQPTLLVHEAYLRLIDQPQVSLAHRAQFFGLASSLMRSILVDHARRQGAAKRPGGAYQLSLGQADRVSAKAEVDLVALDDALQELATSRPQHSRIVELRFFGGLSIPETAEALGISHATVEREWSLARAWLRRELSR